MLRIEDNIAEFVDVNGRVEFAGELEETTPCICVCNVGGSAAREGYIVDKLNQWGVAAFSGRCWVNDLGGVQGPRNGVCPAKVQQWGDVISAVIDEAVSEVDAAS